ncbi:MAG: hypothetical protein C0410_06205 [Anaerolinea sp.]|nr:hypothetical protein [Anaerolinea sp.]
MTEKIRMNYAAVEDMAKHLQMVEQQLRQTAQNAQKWAQTMQNGAMQGPTGESFAQALGVFSQKVNKLAEAFHEEHSDVRKSMAEMQRADTTAGQNF